MVPDGALFHQDPPIDFPRSVLYSNTIDSLVPRLLDVITTVWFSLVPIDIAPAQGVRQAVVVVTINHR